MFIYNFLYVWITQNHLTSYNFEREELVKRIGRKYFDGNSIHVFHSTTKPTEMKLSNVLKVLNGMSSWTFQIRNKSVETNPLQDRKSDVTIFFFEGTHDEETVTRKLETFRESYVWNGEGKIMVFIEEDEYNTHETYMSSIYRISKAIHVAVWALNTNNFYTWEPYKKDRCNILETIKQVSPIKLFKPVNLMNLNGCPLMATASFIPPFVFYKNNDTHMYEHGIECEIMNTLSEYLHSDLRYVDLPENEKVYASVSTDGKAIGAMGMLNRMETDVAYSALPLIYDRYQLAEPLTPHMQEDMAWFVPAPSSRNTIESLYKIFSVTIWIMLSTILVLITLIMYYEDKKATLGECIMGTLLASLLMPFRTESKFVPILLHFGSLHIGTAYQSMLLLSIVQDTKEKPIETLKEAADADLFAFLLPLLYSFVNETDNDHLNKILRPGHFSITMNFVDSFRDLMYNKTSMISFPESIAMFFINIIFPRGSYGSKILTLKEKLGKATVAFFTSKGHPLKSALDFKMLHIISAGFVNYWVDKYAGKKYWDVTKDRSRAESLAKPLGVKNLEIIFYVFIFANALGALVFIGELLYHHPCKKKCKLVKT